MVPAAEELAANAVTQQKEMVAINCNSIAGLGRLIVPFTRKRLRLSGEIKQPGGKKYNTVKGDTNTAITADLYFAVKRSWCTQTTEKNTTAYQETTFLVPYFGADSLLDLLQVPQVRWIM